MGAKFRNLQKTENTSPWIRSIKGFSPPQKSTDEPNHPQTPIHPPVFFGKETPVFGGNGRGKQNKKPALPLNQRQTFIVHVEQRCFHHKPSGLHLLCGFLAHGHNSRKLVLCHQRSELLVVSRSTHSLRRGGVFGILN